ncbi:MAG: zinc-binding dehydrogenase, partial [Pseudomonadota bacterium]
GLLGTGASYDPRDVGAAPAEGTAPLIVDAVGSGVTRAAASQLAAPGGTIVHVGLQDGADGLDTRRLTLSEVTFVGAYCYTRADFAEALALLEQGVVDPAGWCESLPLAEGQAAFRAIDGGAAPAKLVLVPGET